MTTNFIGRGTRRCAKRKALAGRPRAPFRFKDRQTVSAIETGERVSPPGTGHPPKSSGLVDYFTDPSCCREGRFSCAKRRRTARLNAYERRPAMDRSLRRSPRKSPFSAILRRLRMAAINASKTHGGGERFVGTSNSGCAQCALSRSMERSWILFSCSSKENFGAACAAGTDCGLI